MSPYSTRVLVSLLAACALVGAAGRPTAGAAPTPPPRFSVTPLPGSNDVRASGVSSAGDLVGYSIAHPDGGFLIRPYHWKAGTETLLPTLAGGEGEAAAVNASGQIVGYSYLEPRVPGQPRTTHAVLWENGGIRDLGTLGGPQSRATGINDAGQVVGWSQTAEMDDEGKPLTHAFLWQNGTMTDLGSLGFSSAASAINGSGDVVGRSSATPPGPLVNFHPVLWRQGQIQDLGLDGAVAGEATGINASGEVVGVRFFSNRTRAFLWADGQSTYLRTLGGRSSTASSISDTGQVLGQSETAVPDGEGRLEVPCFWQDGVPYHLNALVPSDIDVAIGFDMSPNGNIAAVTHGPDSGEGADATLLSPNGADKGPAAIGDLLLPSEILGGATVTGMVVLSGDPGRRRPVRVSLRSSKPALVRVPSSVIVPAGKRRATFRVPTARVRGVVTATVTARCGGASRKTEIRLNPRPVRD